MISIKCSEKKQIVNCSEKLTSFVCVDGWCDYEFSYLVEYLDISSYKFYIVICYIHLWSCPMTACIVPSTFECLSY